MHPQGIDCNNVGVEQGSTLSPILFALYLALVLHILEKHLKTLKILVSILSFVVRRSSHQGGSLQNGLGDEQTCETTLASAYVLCCLFAVWSQLQMKERKAKWK